MKQYDPSKPLTYANAPRQTIDGVERLTDEAALMLVGKIIEEDRDILEALGNE